MESEEVEAYMYGDHMSYVACNPNVFQDIIQKILGNHIFCLPCMQGLTLFPLLLYFKFDQLILLVIYLQLEELYRKKVEADDLTQGNWGIESYLLDYAVSEVSNPYGTENPNSPVI